MPRLSEQPLIHPAARVANRDRFPSNIAERLLALAWWDWGHEKLRSSLADFRNLDIEALLERHGG